MLVLVKFSKDWADEFNCDGFKIYKTSEEWDKDKELIKKSKSFYFGTNEGWDVEDEDNFIDSYTDEEITLEKFEMLESLFPESTDYGFGIFPAGSEDEEDDDNYVGEGENL